MQALNKNVKELLTKIEKLGEHILSLEEELDSVKTENHNLKDQLNNCKAENQRLKEGISSVETQNGNGSQTFDKESIKSELEQYIEELDMCIEKLKKL